MNESEAGGRQVTSVQVRALAGAVGVELDEERAAVLVPQAEQHFALLRSLEATDAHRAEPAGAFRLDAWRRGSDA